jgi:hypothetical protein
MRIEPEQPWARLQADVDCGLRRGGWYRVLTQEGLDVSVSAGMAELTVPRAVLEIRQTPPREWTVVSRPPNSPRVPEAMRDGYLVCPGCRHRAPLPPRWSAARLRCTQCHEMADIAWDEAYLAA